MQAKLEANDPRALAAVSRQLPEVWITEAELRKNRVPTLAFIGELDELRPTVDAMIGVKPNLEVKVLPGRDHISAVLDPELIPTILQFLS
jgi:pimeloyl-ACP methyl ester carboxylesterase